MVEISSDVIRGYNDTMILSILMKEPSYGYGISKEIKEISEGKYVIKETTLYSAFTRMEKNNHIESFTADPDPTGNGKKRTYYRITEEGKAYYRSKCEEWELKNREENNGNDQKLSRGNVRRSAEHGGGEKSQGRASPDDGGQIQRAYQ